MVTNVLKREACMFCSKCGTENDNNNYKCVKCSEILQGKAEQAPAGAAAAPAADNGISTIIPYKNAPALIAYYLGIFSLIPCTGLITGIIAFILGLKGLKNVKEHPEAKGKVHAWIGILCGGFFALLNLAGIAAIFLIK
jgi:hypothetical protein